MQSSREYLAHHLKGSDDPDVLAEVRRSPVVQGVAGAINYLVAVRGTRFGRQFISGAVNDGKLPAFQISGGWRFAPDDLDNWLDSLRVFGGQR
ncbi:helix-turn-helix domain-containing protein [Gordonia humi]|uniref:DNA-binding protein n=1 Tax=Gordonia humi TaxID=686429 RepID=A0A840F0R9_9ACTN|nr:helix-turn-helix domain-containing protein [Gordonia humi]MBB4136083.1 hypothetical protein [Gordonia humi]